MTNNRHDITEINTITLTLMLNTITLTLMTNNRHDITEIVKHHNSNPNDK